MKNKIIFPLALYSPLILFEGILLINDCFGIKRKSNFRKKLDFLFLNLYFSIYRANTVRYKST
jgi:hypothetical protein